MKLTLKKVLCITLSILSAVPAFSGCITLLLNGTVSFGHTLFLFPAAGAALYLAFRLGTPRWAAALSATATLTGAVWETVLNGYGKLMISLAIVLTFISFGVGVLASHLIYTAIRTSGLNKPKRYISAAAALILIAMTVYPLSLFFGDPFLGIKSKRELDVWCGEYLTDTDYSVRRLSYDWYNGIYCYEVEDKDGNGIGKLKYWSGEKKIYCSWENKVYKLNPSGTER